MSMWETLGIQPTTNIAEIKATYAEKSKTVHPEEHPDEFQELHNAYRQAMRYARQRQVPEKTVAKQDPPQPRIAVEFKFTYDLMGPDDNPPRARFYRSPNDMYHAAVLKDLRKQIKSTIDFAPTREVTPELEKQLDLLHIRGSSSDQAASGKLSFDRESMNQEGALDVAAETNPVIVAESYTNKESNEGFCDASFEPHVDQAALAKSKNIAFANTVLLVLWFCYLIFVGRQSSPVITLVLYLVLAVEQYAVGKIYRDWLFTLAAAGLDLYTVIILGIEMERHFQSLVLDLSDVLSVCFILIPVLRFSALMAYLLYTHRKERR